MSSCFDPSHGGKDSIGWCATCDPNAKKGQRGYCGPGETRRVEEAPVIYPNSTNWGFCDTECHRRNGDENMLQARIHFITIRYLKLQIMKVHHSEKLDPIKFLYTHAIMYIIPALIFGCKPSLKIEYHPF